MISFFFKPLYSLIKEKDLSVDIIFFSLLLLLIPCALITGPAIPDILLSLIGLYFLILSLIKKLWKYYKNFFVLIFSLFCLYGLLNSLFSSNPIDSITTSGSIFYFRYLFFSLAVWYLLNNNVHLSRCLLSITLLLILILSIDLLFQYFNGVNLFGNKKFSNERLTGMFGDEPIIGRYIAFLSIFAFVLIFYNFKINKKLILLSISLLVITQVVVFLTGERSPFFLISLFTFLIILYIPKFKSYIFISVIVTLLLFLLIFQLNPIAKNRMIDTSINEISQTQYPFLPYSEIHERHYVTALKMLKAKPLFGVGTNLFRHKCNYPEYYYKERSCSTHPHNFYIQILAEQGIIGFIIFSYLIFYLIFVLVSQLYNQITKNNKKVIPFNEFTIFLLLFTYWWPIIPHMNFYNNWNNVLLMMPFGFFMKYLYGKGNVSNTKFL